MSSPHQRVSWFELFYDLVIVAAVSYTGHTFAAEPSWGLGLWIAAWTLIMFVLWLLTTLGTTSCRRTAPCDGCSGCSRCSRSSSRRSGRSPTRGCRTRPASARSRWPSRPCARPTSCSSPPTLRSRRHVRVLAWSSGAAAGILAPRTPAARLTPSGRRPEPRRGSSPSGWRRPPSRSSSWSDGAPRSWTPSTSASGWDSSSSSSSARPSSASCRPWAACRRSRTPSSSS